jgi:hypothetical protein
MLLRLLRSRLPGVEDGVLKTGTNPTFAFPPDTMGAVGPAQFVVTLNGRFVTFDKTTGLEDGVLNADSDAFFDTVKTAGSFTSDPRVRYDRLSGRWFIIIIDVNFVPVTNETVNPNRILFAWTDAASAGVITDSTVWTSFS